MASWLFADEGIVGSIRGLLRVRVAVAAAGDERRDQHIGIAQQVHETRVNTSSSGRSRAPAQGGSSHVRAFRACDVGSEARS
jgi:hypothetical protein